MTAGLRVWLAAGLLIAVLTGTIVWEQVAFGWHFTREEAPGTSIWHWLREAVVAASSLVLVAALATAPGKRPERVRLTDGGLTLASLVALASLASLALLFAHPPLFQALGAEDGAIEWLTAILLFLASGLSAAALLRRLRQPPPRPALPLLAAAGFAALFFLMGGEEVSWFQRLIGFATPESIAARNWQGEFNLHNFQTDLTELTLYTGTGVFLMLLPLVRETLGTWRWVPPVRGLLPDRTVAAVSAPMLALTYSHWNLLPVQAVFWIGLGVCLVFARTPASRVEARLWSALALLVALGQAAMLLLGDRQVAIYDSSEYREAFFAAGLAAYAWQQWRTRPA